MKLRRIRKVPAGDALGEFVAKLILCNATDRMREGGISPLAGARAYGFAMVAMCRSAGAGVGGVVALARRQVKEVRQPARSRSVTARQRPRELSRLLKPRAVGE